MKPRQKSRRAGLHAAGGSVVETLENRRLLSFSVAFSGTPTLTQKTDVDVTNLNGNQTESFVAANPANPANLIAFSNTGTDNFAWYSSNGGGAWTQVTLPAPAGTVAAADRDPNVEFDRNGVAWLAYLADDTATAGLNHIVLEKSMDGGKTWTAQDLASGIVYHPFLAIGDSPTDASKDNIYVAYRQDITEAGQLDSQIHLRASTDGGATFPVNQVINDLSNSGIGNASYCALAVGPAGRLYAAWEDSTNAPTSSNILVDSSADGGQTWGTDNPILIGATATTGVTYGVGASAHYTIPAAPDQGILTVPSLAVARSGPNAGRVFVCYTFIAPGAGALSTFAQTDIRLAYTDNLLSGAPTWTAKKVNDDTNAAKSQFHPWMSLDPSTNFLYFSWFDCRNASSNNTAQRYASFSTDGGATIRPNVKIADGTSNESSQNSSRDRSNYGDFNVHSAIGGVMNAAWTDNAHTTSNDIYFDRPELDGQLVTATGGAGDDTYYVRLDPSGTFVQIWENNPAHTGIPTFTLLQTAMSSLTLAPGAGKNSITIDYTNGNPLPAGGLTLNGSGDDTLTITGAPAAKFAALNLGAAATLTLTPGGKVLMTNALTIGSQAKLDITDNGLVLGYMNATILPAVQSQLTSGQIMSSALNATTAIGYGEATQVLGIPNPGTGQFMGQTVNANSVLLRYTLLGDADLDGQVNFSDLVRLAQNYGGTGKSWPLGDFNNDSTVDFADLVKLAQNYNAPLPPAPIFAVPAESTVSASSITNSIQPMASKPIASRRPHWPFRVRRI